jgi:phage terminase small subunit
MAEYSLDDTAGRLLLSTLCESVDRLRGAQKLLREEGLITHDRYGEAKAHPAAAIERAAKQSILATLRALRLEPAAAGVVI